VGVVEVVIHLLECPALGLREKCPDGEGVGEATDSEDEVEPPSD
jgi:hypothetical protein